MNKTHAELEQVSYLCDVCVCVCVCVCVHGIKILRNQYCVCVSRDVMMPIFCNSSRAIYAVSCVCMSK